MGIGVYRTLILLLLVFFSTKTYSSTTLVEFMATYDANIKGFAVTAERALTKKDQHYKLQFKADSWAASLNEQSIFQYHNGFIQSRHYHYQQTALGKTRERSLRFLSEKKNIQSLYKDKETSLSYTVKTLDTLNYQLQLSLDIAQGKPSGTYTVANKDSLRQYHFSVTDEEILATEAGSLNTFKVAVKRDDNAQQVTYLWLAKDWHYLLVSLEHYEDNKKKLAIHLKQATVNGQLLISK